MYLQQTFFGPEGIFVASSAEPASVVQPAGVQAGRRVKLDYGPRGKPGSRVGDSGCEYDKQFQEVRSLGGGSSSGSQRRSDSKQSGRRVGGQAKKWPIDGSRWQASLSDLSTHPDAEENWYRADNDGLDGSGFTRRDTPYSCSLMEISPLSSPQRDAGLHSRKPVALLSRKQPLPVSKSPIKSEPRPSRGSSLRSSKGSFVPTNFPPVPRFSPIPANFPGTRLPPEGCDSMHSSMKPRHRDSTCAGENLPGSQLANEVTTYHSQARKSRSRSIHASAAVGDVAKISKPKPKEVWFVDDSPERSHGKRVSFSQDGVRPQSSEACERAGACDEILTPCNGICRGKVRPKEVSFADEGANRVRKHKEVSFVFESRHGCRYAKPGKPSSRWTSRSTSCCEERASMMKAVNIKRRTASEGIDRPGFENACVVKGGARSDLMVDEVGDYSEEELSGVSDVETVGKSDKPVSGVVGNATRVCVLFEPLKDDNTSAETSDEVKNEVSKPTCVPSLEDKGDLVAVKHPAKCGVASSQNTRHSISEITSVLREMAQIKESPVRSSSAVNLDQYPPSPYEATPPEKDPELPHFVNKSRLKETISTTDSPVARNQTSTAAVSAKSPVPPVSHYYHHPNPSVSTPSTEEAELAAARLNNSRDRMTKSLVKTSHNSSSGIGMPLSPPRNTSKTAVWRNSHQIPPISPYAVSVIHGIESDVKSSPVLSPSFIPVADSSKIEGTGGIYDQLESVTPRPRTNSDAQSTRQHCRPHSDSASSHSQAQTSPSAMPRLLLGSKSDHNMLNGSPSCASSLGHYDMPSSAPAFLEGGRPSYHRLPSNLRRSSGGYYQHHILPVCPDISLIPSPVRHSPLPRIAIPLSPSQLSYLSSLSAQSNPSVSLSARGRRRGPEEKAGSPRKVGVTRSEQLYEILSPRSQQWWSGGHYQVPTSIPCGRSHQLELLLQALGVCVCISVVIAVL